MEEFINVFLEWYRNDPHSESEDYYIDLITFDHLKSLSDQEFIDFFKNFAWDGGKIQSGGYRTAPKFVKNLEENYNEFREKILQPFLPGFDLDDWLKWVENFKYFGRGLATIYLNRVNKNEFIIVNNKSIEGLKKLGYKIPSDPLVHAYHAVKEAADSLLEQYPVLKNYFRIDAMMHFLIGTEEGRNAYESVQKSYFDLRGIRQFSNFFGAAYDKNNPAVRWYYETREKLEYLVELLQNELNKIFIINYSERPNARTGRGGETVLKTYVLTGFSPIEEFSNGELFIKLAFHHLNDSPVFDIEIDINEKLQNNPFWKGRNERIENTRMRIPVDGNFPDNWDDLLNRIKEHVDILTEKYLMIVNRKKPVDEGVTSGKTLNMILYGPPGTGKTYETVNKALEILGEDPGDRETAKRKFSDYQKKHRIFFTTFHQNMAYEDFIEGIKPVAPEEDDDFLKYEVQDGLFMQACVEAAFDFIQSNFKKEEELQRLLDFNELFDALVEEVSTDGSKNLRTKSGGEVTVTLTSYGNFSVKHADGEKRYTVSRNRLSRLYEAYPEPGNLQNINRDFRKIIGGSNATAYWSVLNAIAEMRKKHGGQERMENIEEDISYEDKRKIVQKYWDQRKYVILEKDQSKPFVFIIDEINRGNVAQIFGELITLIEEDKRMGRKETLYAELPYSKTSFAVPPNLYLIGTMNTADRSVEALDTALRRRFSFAYMGPEPNKLSPTEDGIDLAAMLTVINKRLEILKDSDHTLGHAWLWDVKNLKQLKVVFRDKILPLLQEYFYNDYEKLGLVLGDAFFVKPQQVHANMFAPFNGGTGLAGQYDTVWQYTLKRVEDLTVEDFRTLEQQIPQSAAGEEA